MNLKKLWNTTRKLREKNINVVFIFCSLSRSPYIEDYLKMGTVQHPESVAMFDLLWKYYEKNRQYVAAAKILSKLSDKHRYEYLYRKLGLAFL